ncbi:Nn.00g006700.m01.CDS01, partial [Neocucurbitaria sp. VM-36]
MPITQNLELALRSLRLKEGSRLLWIDAICINQSDIYERNQQVERMAPIYSCAQNVVIWLGPASPMQSRYEPPWASEPPALVAAGLRDILNRSWFRRMWVVQEAAMSQRATMTCGRQTLSWNNSIGSVHNFIKLMKFAVISPQWGRAGLQGIDMDVLLQLLDLQVGQQLDKPFILTSDRVPKDLIDHAYEMRDKLSSDPRDKIFALLGLSEGHPMLSDFHVDYSVSVDETFQRLWESIRSYI